jgi:hypothetical protein
MDILVYSVEMIDVDTNRLIDYELCATIEKAREIVLKETMGGLRCEIVKRVVREVPE